MLGSGAVVVMDDTTCMVRAAWNLVRFFAHESCGQCTPCREGGSWLEKIMWRIENGAGRMEDLDLLLDVGDNIAPGPFPHASNKADGLPGHAVARQDDDDLLRRPVGRRPHALGAHAVRDEFVAHIEQGRCPMKAPR